VFGIGKTVKVQNRVVYNVLTALGDIGGLYGILYGTLAIFSSRAVSDLYLGAQVQKLFKASTS